MENILLITDRNLTTSLGRTAIHLESGINKFTNCDLLVITSNKFFKNSKKVDKKYLTINFNNFYFDSFFGISKKLKSIDFSKYYKIILTHQFLGYLIKPIKKIDNCSNIEITTFVHDSFPALLFPNKISYKLLNHFYLKPIFKSDNFLFNSTHSFKTFRDFYKLDNIKYIVCGVTVSIDDFYKIDTTKDQLKKKWNLPNKKTFLNVGICEWRKNLKIFIKLAKKYPQYNFIKVGCFSKDDSIEAANLSNIYQFAGINVSEIREMYNLADVYLMPSFFEGFSITGLEALNCNTPVIGSHMSAHKEVYKDLISFVYDPYSIDEYSEKIKKIDDFSINKKLLNQKLSDYSIDNVSKQIFKFLE